MDEAYRALEAIAAKKESYLNTRCAASTAATLLEAVERIDPGRVSEYLWRALALRGPRYEDEREEVGRLGTDAVIAMLILPYEPAIAHALLEPVFVRLPRLVAGGTGYLPDAMFGGPAVVDPGRAAALMAALPAAPDSQRRQGWTRQRRLVARLLASQGDERRRLVQQMTGFWSPDEFDLVSDD